MNYFNNPIIFYFLEIKRDENKNCTHCWILWRMILLKRKMYLFVECIVIWNENCVLKASILFIILNHLLCAQTQINKHNNSVVRRGETSSESSFFVFIHKNISTLFLPNHDCCMTCYANKSVNNHATQLPNNFSNLLAYLSYLFG